MSQPSTDHIDLRAARLAGALRVALGVSLGLHVVLAVTVKMFWRGHGDSVVAMEMPMPVEFSTEAAPDEGGAPTAPLVQSSAAVEPIESEPAPRSPPDPIPESPTKAAVSDAAGEVVPAVSAILSPVSLGEVKSAQVVAERGAMTASAPRRIASNGDANSFPKVAVTAEVANGKPGILARPLYRKNPEPAYPVAARRRRQEGVTLLSVHVTAAGRAGAVTVKQSSGFRLLDDAAAQAVLDWEFEPARIDAEPMESDIEVPVRFRLRE